MTEIDGSEIEDEVLEQIYKTLKEMRKDIERNRLLTEMALEQIVHLKKNNLINFEEGNNEN